MPRSTGEPGVDVAGADVGAPVYVVVPRKPGPVQHLHTGAGGDGDDIDAAMDELFGDITDEEPGRFDIALLVVGAASIAWWALSGLTGPGLLLGGIAIVLGLALPARNALRVVNRRWTGAKDRRRLGRGYPLEVGDRAVAELVRSYERLLALRGDSEDLAADEVVLPAHQALVEVASLLESRRPTAAAEVDYVRRRARAIRSLATSLRAASSRKERARLREALEDSATRARWATAVAQAREQLDASTGLGSLAQLDALRQRIDVEAGRAVAD